MDDISREPLRETQRPEGGSRKGPAEVVRLDEVSVDEFGTGRIGEAERSDPMEGGAEARTLETTRLSPPVPLRLEPFSDRMKPDSPRGEPDRVDQPWQPRRGPGEAADPAEVLSDRFSGEMPDPEPEAEPEPASVEAVEPEACVVDEVETDAEPAAEVEPGAAVESELAPEIEVETDEEQRAVPSVEELTAEEGEIVPAAAEPMQAALTAEDLGDDAPELSDPKELSRVLMAVLLSSREPLKMLRLAEICNSTQKTVKAGLEQLEQDLREQGFPLELLRADDAVRLMTAPVVFPYLERLRKARKVEKLSPAALETLAVIAYRQPVIRAEVEAIRGVKVGPMLRSLLDHKLVKITGRAEVPGRPLQYGTTQQFLDRFGLNSLKDLPSVQEFRSLG